MAKTIGILGGMTPESTTSYYEYITRTYQKWFGDYGFPEIVIYSVSFQEFEDWMRAGEWNKIARGLTQAILCLAKAGADFAVIATNTMHKVFSEIRAKSPIPLISIIDATAEAIRAKKITTVGLLGTIFTMGEAFYKDGLQMFDIQTHVPNDQDQQIVNQIIFEELGRGIIREASKQKYIDVVQRLQAQGAQGIILGCTEIPLLLTQTDCEVPLFDTARIHAEKALQYALSGESDSK